ncbi:MAG: S-layer homology domain-containing protein [Candidatus Peregrinibacteria bacterium]
MKNKNPFRVYRIGRKKRKSEKAQTDMAWLNYVGLGCLTLVLMAVVYWFAPSGMWFKAAVLQLPEPFNGTVMPVEKVPDWAHFKGDSSVPYSAIPKDQMIPLPPYDLSLIDFPDTALQWGNSAQDMIRDTKITYSVVYLGSYETNHQEETGSHLAVDIKMPQGTPVYAIANGQVVKAVTIENGFGHHIVLKHIQVPDPENPGVFTTVYSTYNHLSDVLVSEGQNVMKGDLIAKSGNTGTSTTPHLHFQIDKDSASWHPYWPFTWQESQAAGLSFFEAVNAGLGIDKARQYTINPMNFVTQNLSYNQSASNRVLDVAPPPPPSATPEPISQPTVTVIEDPTVRVASTESAFDTSLMNFTLSGETVSLLGSGVRIIVKDEESQIEQLGDNDSIPVTVEGVGRVLNPLLRKSDFKNGEASVNVKSDEAGTSTVMVGKSAHQVQFVVSAQNAMALAIKHDGNFIPNTIEEIQVMGVDESGALSPTLNFSGEVELTVTEGQAIATPNHLRASDFKNGMATVRLKVLNEKPVVIRAQNGSLVGESSPMEAESGKLFTDLDQNHPNYAAVKFLKQEGIISGYPDGTFRPDKTVNRVEALKMLMLTFSDGATVSEPLPFSDTNDGAWYANTLAAALQKAIVKGYADGRFRPEQTVNRAEYLKILFNSAGVKFEGEIVARPYEDVAMTDWFAPFAWLANQKNIIDVARTLRPADGMTRAQVAETIYRMKMIQKNGLVSYSK